MDNKPELTPREQKQLAINGLTLKTEFTIEMGSSFHFYKKQEYIDWLEDKIVELLSKRQS